MNELAETKLTKLEELELTIIKECSIQAKSIAETGKHLKAIKDGEEYRQRGYSNFTEYMAEACGEIFPFSAKQAYKYIRIWEAYGQRLEQYGNISLNILDMFKDENPDDFAELAEKNDLEHMSVKEAAELRKQLDAATEQISFLTEERNAVAAELDELRKKPVDVAVSEPDEKELKHIREQVEKELKKKHAAESKELKDKLSKAEKEVKDIRKQLADKDNIAEKQRGDYDKRLKELDEKLTSEKSAADERVKALEKKLEASSGKADETLIEFRFYFTQVQEDLGKFLEVLKKIPDADKKKTFRSAAIKFIDMIRADLDKIGE